MTNFDLERTRIHEAGHLVMCHVLGVATGMASVRPNAATETFGWSRHGMYGYPTRPDPKTFDVPYPLMDTRVRRPLEKELCVLLAGDAAVRLYAPVRSSGFVEQAPCLATADKVVTELTRRETRDLVAFESGAPPNSDYDTARHRGMLAVGEHLSSRYMLMFQAVADEILSWDRPRRQIHAIADAFSDHHVLSARTIRRLLNEN